MIKTLPITEARETLPILVKKTNKLRDSYAIIVNGKPEAVLMSAAEYDSLQETLEILADKELMKDLRSGLSRRIYMSRSDLDIP